MSVRHSKIKYCFFHNLNPNEHEFMCNMEFIWNQNTSESAEFLKQWSFYLAFLWTSYWLTLNVIFETVPISRPSPVLSNLPSWGFVTHIVYSFNLNQLSHKNTLQGCQVHCLERNHRDLQLLFHERIFPNSCVTLVGLERRLWNNRYIVNAKYDWCCFIDGSSKSPVSAVFSRFCKNHHQSFVRWHL